MSMGGGGGGGTSGQVAWPEYFQAWHANILGSPLAMTFDFLDIVNAMTNPFATAVAYDPTAYVAAIDARALAFKTAIDALDPVTSWESYLTSAVTNLDSQLLGTTEVVTAETAYNAVVDADYVNIILPRFQRGLQDANAVMSSAFVIGEALLEAEVLRKKATFSADLRMQNHKERVDAVLRSIGDMITKASADDTLMNNAFVSYVDSQRISAILKREQLDRDISLEELDTKWDLDLFTYAGNLLAAGHGGVSSSGTSKATAMQSVLGGAMSGASMGTAVYPGWGTLIGALGGAAFGIGQQIAG